jgi:uncharacterized membrane protein YdjX (TVP38/TMEM64 family)
MYWSKYVPRIFLAAICLGAVAFSVRTVDFSVLKDWCYTQMDNMETILVDAGIWGPVVVFVIYLVSTVFMLPLWGFHLVCGYVYGTWKSSLLIASTQALCAGAAFLCARYIVRPYIRGFFVRRYGQKYIAIDKVSSRPCVALVEAHFTHFMRPPFYVFRQ